MNTSLYPIIIGVGMPSDTISIYLIESSMPGKRREPRDHEMVDKFGVRFQSAEAFYREKRDDRIEAMCS